MSTTTEATTTEEKGEIINISPAWPGFIEMIATGLKCRSNTKANKLANALLRHVGKIVEYHRQQEVSGAEYGVSAAVPASAFELYRALP